MDPLEDTKHKKVIFTIKKMHFLCSMKREQQATPTFLDSGYKLFQNCNWRHLHYSFLNFECKRKTYFAKEDVFLCMWHCPIKISYSKNAFTFEEITNVKKKYSFQCWNSKEWIKTTAICKVCLHFRFSYLFLFNA